MNSKFIFKIHFAVYVFNLLHFFSRSFFFFANVAIYKGAVGNNFILLQVC